MNHKSIILTLAIFVSISIMVANTTLPDYSDIRDYIVKGKINVAGLAKDGNGADARFNSVNTISIDSKGILYTGSEDGTIRRMKIE